MLSYWSGIECTVISCLCRSDQLHTVAATSTMAEKNSAC